MYLSWCKGQRQWGLHGHGSALGQLRCNVTHLLFLTAVLPETALIQHFHKVIATIIVTTSAPPTPSLKSCFSTQIWARQLLTLSRRNLLWKYFILVKTSQMNGITIPILALPTQERKRPSHVLLTTPTTITSTSDKAATVSSGKDEAESRNSLPTFCYQQITLWTKPKSTVTTQMSKKSCC